MGWRADFTRRKQDAYGGYCSNIRGNGLIPIPYHKFADLIEDGLTCKQIIKLHLSGAVEDLHKQ